VNNYYRLRRGIAVLLDNPGRTMRDLLQRQQRQQIAGGEAAFADGEHG
jgi:hypothetical protein